MTAADARRALQEAISRENRARAGHVLASDRRRAAEKAYAAALRAEGVNDGRFGMGHYPIAPCPDCGDGPCDMNCGPKVSPR